MVVLVVLCGCERARACDGFDLPPLSCGADGFEATIYVFDWRKPMATADFGCGFEFDGETARVVPSGEVCTDTSAESDAGGERRAFMVHCKLPEGAWNVATPGASSIRVTVEKGVQTCGT